MWVDASRWERFKQWAIRNPLTPLGRWVEDRVPIDQERLEGKFHKFGGEPRWTAEDRAVVVVWQDEESQRCPECGTYPWEWEEGEEVWEADVDDCEGCRQREDLREQVASEHDPEMIRGWKLRFFRKGTSDGE